MSAPPYPTSVLKLEQTLLRVSGVVKDRPFIDGVSWRFLIRDSDGFVRYASPRYYDSHSIPAQLIVQPVIAIGSFSVQLVTYLTGPLLTSYQVVGRISFATTRFSSGTAKVSFHRLSLTQLALKEAGRVRRLKRRLLKRNSKWTISNPIKRPTSESRTATVHRWWWNGVAVTINDDLSVYTSYFRTYSGSVTPQFGRIKGKTRLPVNGYHLDVRWMTDSGAFSRSHYLDVGPDYVTYQSSSFLDMYHIAAVGEISYPPVHLDHGTRNRSISRLVTKAGASLDANLAQDGAQFGQMTRLISNSMNRITRSITSLRKGNFSGAVNALWTAGNPRFRNKGKLRRGAPLAENWLELQYGWKPLLQDIRGFLDSLARFNLANYEISTVTSSATHKYFNRVPIFEASSNPRILGYREATQVTTYRFGVRYKVADAFKAFAAQTGFTNPLNLAWEVLPYSFVVDWFVPVGPYLETFSSFDGLVFIDGFETRFTAMDMSSNVNATYKGFTSGDTKPNLHWYETRGENSCHAVLHDRLKLTSFPSATKPEFKNPFSTTHVLNALALLRSAF